MPWIIDTIKTLIQHEKDDWKQIRTNLKTENLQKTKTAYIEAVKKRPIQNLTSFAWGLIIVAAIILASTYINDQIRTCTGTWTANNTAFKLTIKQFKQSNQGQIITETIPPGITQYKQQYPNAANNITCTYTLKPITKLIRG